MRRALVRSYFPETSISTCGINILLHGQVAMEACVICVMFGVRALQHRKVPRGSVVNESKIVMLLLALSGRQHTRVLSFRYSLLAGSVCDGFR